MAADVTTSAKPKVWEMEVVRGDKWPPYSFQINDENGDVRTLVGAVITQHVKAFGDEAGTTILKTITTADGSFSVSSGVATYNTFCDLPVTIGGSSKQAKPHISDIEILFAGQTKPETPYTVIITVLQDTTNSNV